MLIKGSFITDASGSLGGITAARNRGGMYLRSRTTPVNPNTTRQVNVRLALRNLSIDWPTLLTQANRDGWDVYAANVPWQNKQGEAIFMTGLNAFIRTNSSRLQVGLAQLNVAPAIFNLAPAEAGLTASATAASQNLLVGFDDTALWVDITGAYQAVYVGLPINASHTFFKGPFRFAGVILGDVTTPPTTPATIASPFLLQAGELVYVQTRIGLDDGRLSDRAQATFLVTA